MSFSSTFSLTSTSRIVLLLVVTLYSSCYCVVGQGFSVSSSRAIPASREKVAKDHKHHVAAAIDSLLNIDNISFDHEEANHLNPVIKTSDPDVSASEPLYSYLESPSSRPQQNVYLSQYQGNNPSLLSNKEGGDTETSETADGINESEALIASTSADLTVMNETFFDIFNNPRSDDHNKEMKETARNAILDQFRTYGVEAFTQAFTANKRGSPNKGTNIIALLPGKYRGVEGRDNIILIGAHYDTVSVSPGIDDNASGVIVLLELARLLRQLPQLNHTVMFVGFDLEELGLLGSLAFVREYLIPRELIDNKANFLGAYVIDMALNYDPTPGSQTLPRDIMIACPGVTGKIAQDGNRGDFMAVWMRKGVDGSVYKSLLQQWKSSPKYKLRTFDPVLPLSEPSASDLYRFGTFTRSDHASFWYHKHPNFKKSLNAILLTDMGVWRGSTGSKCYHNWCDDATQLTDRNLKFLKNTIDTLYRVIVDSPPVATNDEVPDESVVPSIPTFGSRNPSGDREGGRGVRTNRGRGPTTVTPVNRQQPPKWPTFHSLPNPSSFFPSSFGSSFPSIPSLLSPSWTK